MAGKKKSSSKKFIGRRGRFFSNGLGTQRGNGGGDPKDDERVCGGDDDREQVHLTASAGTKDLDFLSP